MKSRSVAAWSRSELAMVMDIMESGGQKVVSYEAHPTKDNEFIIYYTTGELAESGKALALNTSER